MIENFSYKKAILVQNDLRQKLSLVSGAIKEFKVVAGIDLAYWQMHSKEYAVCCIVLLEQKTKQIIESKYSFGKITIPYIPGCLAFRELPLILETVKKLNAIPDLYMFDGNGYLHPRHMGIASHASFYLKNQR